MLLVQLGLVQLVRLLIVLERLLMVVVRLVLVQVLVMVKVKVVTYVALFRPEGSAPS